MRAAMVLLAGALCAGCDSENPGCDDHGPAGSRADQCLASAFKINTPRYLEVAGVVRRGESGAPNAVVHVAPFSVGSRPQGVTLLADSQGAFGPVPFVPFRYDLTARLDRDVIAFRDLAYRYFEPTLETDVPSFARAFTSRIEVALEEPVPPGKEVAFFVSGDGTYEVKGSAKDGLALTTRDFSNAFTLHAVLRDIGGELATATAYGRAEGRATANQTSFVRLGLRAIDGATYAEPTFAAETPPGFSISEIAITALYSQSSYALFTTMKAGVAKRFPVLPFLFFLGYRAVATSPDGATVSTPLVPFDPYPKSIKIVLPDPAPAVLAPADGATMRDGDRLEVAGSGIVEHVLDGEGRTVRMIGRAGSMPLPALDEVGGRPKGSYTWRVRSYPNADFAENLSGAGGRRNQPVATSAPRTLIF